MRRTLEVQAPVDLGGHYLNDYHDRGDVLVGHAQRDWPLTERNVRISIMGERRLAR